MHGPAQRLIRGRGCHGRTLLLLAPSRGFGGGIERVAAIVEDVWPGGVRRLDLYDANRHDTAAGNLAAKIKFAVQASVAAAQATPERCIVLSLHIGLLPAAYLAAEVGRARLALFLHGTEVWTPLGGASRWLLSRCDAVVATTQFTADVLRTQSGNDSVRVGIAPLPAEQHMLDEGKSTDRSGPKPGSILSVGRIERGARYKGWYVTADAMTRVMEVHPSARWIVVGDGDDRANLMEYCERVGISSAVSFLGAVSDGQLRAEYGGASVFVMPSVADPEATPPIGEGFGLVYAEAGAFGVPSIACSQGGGALEIVKHGETGLTVPPEDSAALAAAICRLLRSPSERDRLGAAVQRRVHSEHTPGRFAEALAHAICATHP